MTVDETRHAPTNGIAAGIGSAVMMHIEYAESAVLDSVAVEQDDSRMGRVEHDGKKPRVATRMALFGHRRRLPGCPLTDRAQGL